MTMKVYDQGEPARCSVEFRDTLGVLADPVSASFVFTTPAGVTTTYVSGTDAQVVADSIGMYHVDVTCSAAGEWYYRWKAEGVVALVESGQFLVQGSAQA